MLTHSTVSPSSLAIMRAAMSCSRWRTRSGARRAGSGDWGREWGSEVLGGSRRGRGAGRRVGAGNRARAATKQAWRCPRARRTRSRRQPPPAAAARLGRAAAAGLAARLAAAAAAALARGAVHLVVPAVRAARDALWHGVGRRPRRRQPEPLAQRVDGGPYPRDPQQQPRRELRGDDEGDAEQEGAQAEAAGVGVGWRGRREGGGEARGVRGGRGGAWCPHPRKPPTARGTPRRRSRRRALTPPPA
jgi:hypothetical protein